MPNFLTREGLAELQAELREIKEVLLPQTLEVIEAARAQGDLRENADYEIARARKEDLERRLIEIEDILADYELIEDESASVASGTDRVRVGSTVVVQYTHDNSRFEVQIVGASEADALNSRISNESPLAKAVLGKRPGETVKVNIRLNDVNKTRVVREVKIVSVS